MGTQYVYSHSLAGVLFLVALVALGCGGCGEMVSKECPVLEPIWSAPCVGSSEEVAGESDEGTLTISDEPGGDLAQAGVLGYSDPAADEGIPIPSFTEDGSPVEQGGDADAGSSETATPWMANWGEDRMDVMNEESNVEMNEGGEPGDDHSSMYEETPCTPPATEQAYTPEPTGESEGAYAPESVDGGGPEYAPEATSDTEGEYVPEPTDDPEQEYVPEPTGDTEREYLAEPTSDPAQAYTPEPTGDGDDAVPPYESYIPAMPADVGVGGSSSGPDSEPSP